MHMKRHALAVLIHPYKNMLVDETRLRQALDELSRKILELVTANPTLRLNLILPGSMLDYMNPLQLSNLREVQKSDRLEWLTPGFTEPFVSFSPPWLFGENIKAAHQSFREHIGTKPAGYVPPFSNWEPSSVQTLNECGIHYSVLSRSVFPPDVQSYCGYWTTEHVGISMVLFPSHVFDNRSAPPAISEWLEQTIAADPRPADATRVVTIEYLVPLFPDGGADPFAWLHALAKALDILLLRYQITRLQELSSIAYPVGLQFIPSSITMNRNAKEPDRFFANYLYTFNQLGILHRKLLNCAEAVKARTDGKERIGLQKQLFTVQDINRFLPAARHGFQSTHDRLWTFRRLIGIETALAQKENARGGQIRITDYLRNGTKCILLTNKPLQICIDLKNGGQIFELDFRDRGLNLCAGYHSQRHAPSRILMPGVSCTAFVDHLFEREDSVDNAELGQHERGTFVSSAFDYKVRKTEKQVKAILSRQGALCMGDKPCPVHIEKVFGLEQDAPALSFVYQLANPSLAPYQFAFGIELTFCFPGVALNACRLFAGGRKPAAEALDSVMLPNVDCWRIEDTAAGVLIETRMQKKVRLMIHAVRTDTSERDTYQGTRIVMIAPVTLPENGVWSLMGKMRLKAIAEKQKQAYAI